MRMYRPLLAAAAIVAALPAQAEQKAAASEGPAICARHEIHARDLADRFGAFPLSSGVSADGIACVTSAGENGRQDVGL